MKKVLISNLLYILAIQDWWDEKLPENGMMSCLSVIPKVLLAGAITMMDEAYYKLAVWLNDRGICFKNKPTFLLC